MFGEYAHIASFLSPRDGYGNNMYGVDAMPEYLRPLYLPPHPWGPAGRDKSGLAEDFIMIAEFSELEGPKPLMTIPKEGAGLGFDQNSFAVRILAVDHQTSSSQGFSISEDAQVVLSDVDAGVFAFVHHLVLYDNTARGFVRPHCIAYITTDQRKLITFYEEMSSKFKKVARFIKYGNLLIFMGDLERHLKDLEHTKGFLLNQVSKQRLKDGDANPDVRKNADNELHRKLQTIHQSTSEIKEILSILKPLQSDKRLEARFRLLEERAFQGSSEMGGDKLSLQENWFNDMSSLDGFDIRCGSLREPQNSFLSLFKPRDYKPLLVETKKAKRFNAPLRGLHELCSWGAKEGLKKLRSLYAYFKRDMVLLELEKMESKLMRPSCTSIYHGQCVTGNLLAGIHIKQHSSGFDEDEEFSMLQYPPWASSTSLESTDSFKSADSFSSALRGNNASPGSGHTNESLNGHIYQSAPSSFDKHDISLLMADEYYGYGESNEYDDNSERMTERTVSNEESETHGDSECTPKETSVCDGAGNTLKGFRREIYVDDEDEPPIIVFKEKIKRPLSVVSLGCTDDENEERSTSLDSSERKDTLHNDLGKEINIENTSGSYSNNPSNDEAKSCTNKNKLGAFSFNNDDEESDQTTRLKHDSITRLSPCTHDSNTTLRTSSASPSNIHSSCCNPTKSVGLATNNRGKTIPGSNNSTPCHNDTMSSIFTSSPVSSSLSSTLSQQEQTAMLLAHHEGCDTEKCIRNANHCPRDGRKYSHSPSSSLTTKHQRTPPLSSSPIATSIQRQISAATSSQSDFTDISIRELFPYLTDSSDSNNKPLPPDVQSAFSFGENFDANEGTESFSNGNNGVNPSSWRPRHGLYTLGDWLNNINRGRTGYGILEVLNGYSNLQHVVYSLMIGRPVLVVGVSKLEPEVLKIVNALAVFIPSTKKRQQYILEWTSKHLRISDLSKLRLIGLCRDDRKSLDSCIPSAVKKASTVIDVEKRNIYAPQYQGQLIPCLLAKKKHFKTDAVMLSYIHWWLMDILGKAFIFFHSFYLGSAGSMMSSVNLREHRDSYRATVNGIMGRLGVKDSDCAIVEYLAELTKLSRLETHGLQRQDSDNTTHPLTIHFMPCQTFKC